jgi:hypothetical protein
MSIDALVPPPRRSSPGDRPRLPSPIRQSSWLDVSTLETVALELVFERGTEATGALEASAELSLSRSGRTPLVTRVRLDDPSLERGVLALARRLRGNLRAKRFVVAVKAASGQLEELYGLADLVERVGLELAIAGDGDHLASRLSSHRGRLFAAVLRERAGVSRSSLDARRAAASAKRAGAPLLVDDIATFDDLETALALGARYVAGPVVETGLGPRLVSAARAREHERDGGALGLRESEEEISQVRTAIAADPDARDLTRITLGWVEPLDEARREVERAERTEAQARSMMDVAERDLALMFESYASGNAQRAERLMHCEASFLEAKTLHAAARERAGQARERARGVRAAFELRKEALRAALEARALRLSHDDAWADRFFSDAS